MPIQISIQNQRELQASIQGIINTLNDPSGVWDPVIRRVLRPRIRETFQTDGDGRWPPRKDSLPHPLLRKSLRLYRSLIQEGAPGQVNIQTPDYLIYGTDVPYADYHEFGTRNIPARPFLRFSVERGLDVKVAREIDMWFQSAFNRRG